MLTISSDVSILGRQRQPLSGLLWAYCNPPITSPGKLPLLISNSSAGFEPTTSRSAGRILGDPRAVSQVGRKGGTKVFKYGRKSPWVPTLTGPFPSYYCAQSANTSQWVLFVCSYMTAIVSITVCLAHAPKKCTQSGNFQFDIKSTSDPTRLLVKCKRTLLELNFYQPCPSSWREWILLLLVYVLHKTWN